MTTDPRLTALEDEFSTSWDHIESFFANSSKMERWGDLVQICDLIAEMRRRGFDRQLRAGQSLLTFILSRSRWHGLHEGQPRLNFNLNSSGGLTVVYETYSFGEKEKLETERVEITPKIEALLARLLSFPLIIADIRALIFDLDGVITDTAEYHYHSWQRLADEEGIPFTRQDNEALRGISRRESLTRLLKGRAIDEATAQAWMRRKNDYFFAALAETPPIVLPGVLNLLAEAEAAGIATGVASASKNVHPILDKLGLPHRFNAVADANTVANSKPAPDLFVWTAGRLNKLPSQTIIFEDSEAGVAAGLAGGFWVVGLGSANIGQAHLMLPDLAKAHIADVIAVLPHTTPE